MSKTELIAELNALELPAHRTDLISLRDYAVTLATRFGPTDYLQGTLVRLRSVCYVTAPIISSPVSVSLSAGNMHERRGPMSTRHQLTTDQLYQTDIFDMGAPKPPTKPSVQLFAQLDMAIAAEAERTERDTQRNKTMAMITVESQWEAEREWAATDGPDPESGTDTKTYQCWVGSPDGGLLCYTVNADTPEAAALLAAPSFLATNPECTVGRGSGITEIEIGITGPDGPRRFQVGQGLDSDPAKWEILYEIPITHS